MNKFLLETKDVLNVGAPGSSKEKQRVRYERMRKKWMKAGILKNGTVLDIIKTMTFYEGNAQKSQTPF